MQIWGLYESAGAAMRKYHGLGDLYSRNVFSQFWRLDWGQGASITGFWWGFPSWLGDVTLLTGVLTEPIIVAYVWGRRVGSKLSSISSFYFLIYFIDYAITVLPFSPLYSPLPCNPSHPPSPPLSSCPWVLHISSLASTIPILFLTSPCLFCTYCLCFLFRVPFRPSPSLLITLQVISISVVLFLF